MDEWRMIHASWMVGNFFREMYGADCEAYERSVFTPLLPIECFVMHLYNTLGERL